MSEARRKAKLPGEAGERECSRCGCRHLIPLGAERRWGNAKSERFTCRHCGKVLVFLRKASARAG